MGASRMGVLIGGLIEGSFRGGSPVRLYISSLSLDVVGMPLVLLTGLVEFPVQVLSPFLLAALAWLEKRAPARHVLCHCLLVLLVLTGAACQCRHSLWTGAASCSHRFCIRPVSLC